MSETGKTTSFKTTSLVCMTCGARGKVQWATDGHHHRQGGLVELSRGFKYIDRGPQFGSHFLCMCCNTPSKEY